MSRVPQTSLTLAEPWFTVVSRWIELETVTGAVAAQRASKAGLYQLVET